MNRTTDIATRAPSAEASGGVETPFGVLPQWNLDDLYPGMESPEFQADFNAIADKAESCGVN
jgi:oligoendopeptidase F